MRFLISVVIGLVVLVLCLFFGGWTLQWGVPLPIGNEKLLWDILAYHKCFLLKAGEGWYGFIMGPRFFELEWLQWTLFIFGFIFFIFSFFGARKPKD
ncbi:MAG: hypothetical protein LBE38_05110 [Deltaproteobacteria bacterium]|jgi:hypothetical protein|nr:hypothetical protein [Deltaproteobacteria bacterium]